MGVFQEIFGDKGFDSSFASEDESSAAFNPMPAGKYPVSIDSAEVLDTKSGNGKRLTVSYTVLEGQYEGRKLWSHINISNPSAECVRIGCQQLGKLGKAVGLDNYVEEDLIGKTLTLGVQVDGDYNVVKAWVPYQPLATPTTQYRPKAAPTTDSAPTATVAPWLRKQ